MNNEQRRSASPEVPDGYMRDGRGALIPTALVKPIDKLRDELVKASATQAREMQTQLGSLRARLLEDIDAFVDLSAAEYGVSLGGKKGNLTLSSYDGQFKLVVQVADTIVFDERLKIAKALIDECIHDWGANARPELMALLNDAFQVDKEGKIATGRVLGLRRLAIEDEKWQRAMTAISESIQTSFSKRYIRFYERHGEQDYRPISLDIARL